MNASFFAGAGDVIECFVRELGILQASLKAEVRPFRRRFGGKR
jgi:hypothetical protein